MAEPTPFIVTELTGEGRQLVLQDRALPYRPIRFKGGQRVSTTWYPGSPVASQQVFGPTEKPSTFSGMWKDRFVGAWTVGQGGPMATLDGDGLPDAAAIVAAIDDFRVKGQVVQVSWDAIVRVGIITEFESVWQRREDVEWSLTVDWQGRGDAEPPAGLPASSLSDAAAKARSGVKDAEDAASDAPLNMAPDFFARLDAGVSSLETSVSALQDTIAQQVSQALRPVDSATRAAAVLTFLADAAAGIKDDVEGRVAQTLFGISQLREASVGDCVAAEAYARGLGRKMRDLRDSSLESAYAALSAASPTEVQAVVIATADQDLRDVSADQYGTPDEWRTIAAFNGLPSSRLTPGQVVYVPLRPDASAAGAR